MWIFTRYGFFSVTVSVKEPKKMQIRARAREDLERLMKFADNGQGLKIGPIIETPDADYRYRMICTRLAWEDLALMLAQDIDYNNFKNQIKDPARHRLYERVWGLMLSLQREDRVDPRQGRLFQVFPGAGETLAAPGDATGPARFGDVTEEQILARLAELDGIETEEDLPGFWNDDAQDNELDG
jgi:hypothetical protein